VFWLLDAVVLVYLAWWLVDDRARPTGQFRRPPSCCSSSCPLPRRFVSLNTRPLRVLRPRQLDRRHALAGAGWPTSSCDRPRVAVAPASVGALRDAVLESAGLGDGDVIIASPCRSPTHARSVGVRVSDPDEPDRWRGAQAVVLERGRPLDLPALYENARFGVYALR
jgi:hypothetical protein